MAKKVQLMTNAKQWQVVDGVEVLVDVPQEDIDPIIDSSCVEIEGYRTLEETINQENMFTPQITETKVHSKVGGVYHDSVVDGAYEEAILYGNTQVNLVTSPTREGKYIPQTFTSFQGDEGVVGVYVADRTNQVAPLIKGVSMVNLCQETSATIPCQHTIAVANHNAKPNTKYTLKCKFTEKNKNAGIMVQSYGYKDGTWGYIEISKTIQNLGDDVLLTFTTHEQADSIIIYNNPAFCEDTNDSITLDDIMVIEGDVTDLNLPFFKGMRSVELSRPLTNLFTDDLRWGNQGTIKYTNSGGNVTVTSNSIASWSGITFYLGTLKQNTKYLVMWDSLTQTQTSTSSLSIIAVYDVSSNTNIGTANSKTECPTLRSIVFDTTGRNYTNIGLRVHATLSNSETGTTTVTGLRVFEWDDSLRTLDLQTIGYFSGTKYVSVRALETEGKNLYPYGDINFTPTSTGWFDAKGTNNMYGDIAQKSKCRFLLRKGTYKLSSDYYNRTNLGYMSLVTDKEEIIGDTTFTLDKDTYLTLRLQPVEANVPTTLTNIQIERGETATTYEAYQSRYYKPRETEEIILRSLPNGVCDTFNLQTGEYIQRVGEIVLDNTETWGMDTTENAKQPNTNIFYTAVHSDFKPLGTVDRAGSLVCDKVNVVPNLYFIDKVGIMSNTDTRVYVRVLKTDAPNVATFTTYIQNNPLTLQYELKEPIIRKIQTTNRIYNGQTNALVSMGNNLSALTYYSANTKIKLNNLSPVPAIVEPITILPFDVRLKPNTTYTVKYLSDHSTNAKINLGGTEVVLNPIASIYTDEIETLVKTPTILKHKQILMGGNGRAYQVIVVEGDIIGTELPYFEGMKDVKMPIVKNIGKNLFDGELIVDKGINKETGVYHNSEDWVTTKNLIPITKGKKISVTIDADDEDITSNRRYVYVYKYDMNGNFIANDRHDLGLNTKTFTMNHYGYIKCTIKTHNVKNITITETDAPQPCIDYRVNSVYAVQGEYPITNEMIEQGGFSASLASTYEDTKYDNAARLRSKELIPVKPNTTYAFAHSFSKFAYNVYQWNGNKKFIDGVSRYFASGQIETITTTADTQYIHFLMSKHDASQAITVAEYDWSQFHMYELDSTINLRSLPNGVKDELNLLTGEYIQRVGEVVLDGSEGWRVGKAEIGEMAYFMTDNYYPQGIKLNTTTLKLTTQAYGYPNVAFTDVWHERQEGLSSSNGTPGIRAVSNTYSTVKEWKAFLQSNPITVQYELAEPIISHVRLVSNNQEREVGVKLPNGVCNTYNPSTGITTVRVGKVVLDGSEDEGWKTAADNSGGAFRFETQLLSGKFNGTTTDTEAPILLCDKYATYKFYLIYKGEKVGISFYMSSHIVIYDNKYADLASFKQALQSDPITLWYELKYPQIQPDIVLPNGVHDEYNPETGVYTKRIGFAELDGSTDERLDSTINTYNKENTIVFFARQYTPLTKKYEDRGKGYPIHTNQFEYSDIDLGQSSGGGLSMDIEGAYMAFDGNPCFAISKEKLEPFGFTNDMNSVDMKQQVLLIASKYLSQNPLKVWYELATPIIYQLTPYFGLPQPYAYKDGYLIHDSAYPETTTLPPEFKYKLVANRTGQIVQNGRKLQEHTTRLSNLEALIIEATIESLFNRELQLFELELMDIQLIEL